MGAAGGSKIPPEVSRIVLLKEGKIIADGEKSAICTDANLSLLFDTSVHLVQANGYYQAMPGSG